MPDPHRKKPLTFLTSHSYIFAGLWISTELYVAVSLGTCPCIMEISELKEEQKAGFHIGKAQRCFRHFQVWDEIKLVMNSLKFIRIYPGEI